MKSVLVAGLALLLSPPAAWAGDAAKVQVITSFSNATQCISPVRIRKIDGKEAAVNRMGFSLEPGSHTLSGSALIDASICPTLGATTRTPPARPLEADFVAGKVYYVGYDHSSRDRNEWKIVVWKIEDAKE